MELEWAITFFIKAYMSHRITIALKKTADGGGDAFHAFGWLRENMRNRYCYIGTTWIELGNSQHRKIWSSIELPHDPNGGILAEFDVYTDPDTRERIMTFEIDDDDDLALVRLRFNEVPLWRNVELDRLMLAREKINAMLEVKGDD